MTALRRMTFKALSGMAAALALGLGAPAAAQQSDAPVDVTAAPPPSAEDIGPSQLRDFNLQGTVTRPGDRPAVSPAQPATTAPAQPRSGEAVPGEAAQRPAPRAAGASAPPASLPSGQPAGSTSAVPGFAGGAAPVTPSAPLDVTTGTATQPGVVGVPEIPSTGGLVSWPWIAALIALLGGGALLAWTRRGRRQRYGDPGRLAFSGLAPETDAKPAPFPPAKPRPDPVPPRAEPRPAPRPDPVPRPQNDGLIVSTSLKPRLDVEFHPERVVLTEQEAMLQFEVILDNLGSASARDVLIEARLFTAHAGMDRDLANFFQNPVAAGDRISSVDPLTRVSLKSAVRLPLDQLHAFEAAGRKLVVPMIGFNILYREGSGDGQGSASFLVGRGNDGDEKLGPIRLDLGPRIFRGLSARPHSLGLQQVA